MLMATVATAFAAIEEHVQWEASLETGSDASSATLIVKAEIADGWHIYGLEMPDLGPDAGIPDPTTLTVISPDESVKADGALSCTAQPTMHFDSFMRLNMPWLSGNFELRQPLEIDTSKATTVRATVRYMACNESSCTPPARFDIDIPIPGATASPATQQVAETAAPATAPQPSVASTSDSRSQQWWEPVELSAASNQQSNWMILLLGFAGGLIALMTPCIWPMIPMTVSYFLKRSRSRRRAIGDAATYAGSILLIFLVLGLVLTLIFGPGKLNEIATGAVFNLIFFAMLVFFAISFFGAFEIKLPSKWTNAADAKAGSAGGIVGIFFMAFTLVLVSFSCTGPIIGTLLVEAFSQSSIVGPLLGMGGFALGLALPFGLFAFFPSMLKELPKSGSWLNTVKVVLGFIELILSLKFLSVADLAYGWRILDREVFLSLWIVLFVLLGLYLLGKLRFSHDSPSDHTPVSRFFLALASLAFAVYLVPGLWGAPLKAVSAFAPPLYTQDFNLYGESFKEYDDYEEGMKAAAEEKKPVLIDFSGYGCVNCRKMEGAVLDDPNVKNMILDNFVVIKLMVDEKKALPEPIKVTEFGKEITLYTYGDKWSYLQRYKFNANAQPYYVILDGDGSLLSGPFSYEENIPGFTQFLEKGIKGYAK